MNIIFHAGHHKTGTTTFQKLLASNRAKLLEQDVFVPMVGGMANMGPGVIYPAQRGDWSPYEAVLKEAKSKLSPNGTLIFSAEDLENCLFDATFGRQFASLAATHGFHSTRWVFVQRNQFEYFESLYSELSKHGQVLRYDAMAFMILRDGLYTCSSPQFRWFYVFDYARATDRFRKAVTDSVVVLPFETFVAEPVGQPILELIGKAQDYAGLVRSSIVSRENVRLSPEAVERGYVANFLGPVTDGAQNANHVDAIVAQRLKFIDGVRPEIQQAFGQRYGLGNVVRR